MGNIGVACLALGEIRDHREARKIIRESNDIKVYQPLQDVYKRQAHNRRTGS